MTITMTAAEVVMMMTMIMMIAAEAVMMMTMIMMIAAEAAMMMITTTAAKTVMMIAVRRMK